MLDMYLLHLNFLYDSCLTVIPKMFLKHW